MTIILTELKALGSKEKREMLPRFFKTGKGEYGEGDKFLGVTVPLTRSVAKKHKDMPLQEVAQLITSEWHEVRLCALCILTLKFKKANEAQRKEIFDFYLSHTEYINNWDLVDLSTYNIVGTYLLDKPREILYRLAESSSLWENRIAIVSTYAFIRQDDLEDTYNLAVKMMQHPHDLMHKAIGWMLREAGKRDEQRLQRFVMQHRKQMPRTMLRYAIEKFPEAIRKEMMS